MKIFRFVFGFGLLAAIAAVAIFSANLRPRGVELTVSDLQMEFIANVNCFRAVCDCEPEKSQPTSSQEDSGGNAQTSDMDGRKLHPGSVCKVHDLDVSSLRHVRICPTFGGSTPNFSAGILSNDGDPQFLIFGYGSLSLARFHGIVNIKYQDRMYTPCDLKSLFHFARFMRQVF